MHPPPTRPVHFLPGPVAAAVASTLLAVVFALYLVPVGTICGPYPRVPDIRSGQAFFGTPETTVLSIQRDGAHRVGDLFVRRGELARELRKAREAAAWRPLEILADSRVSSRDVAVALVAARDAGYTEAYVFGRYHSLLEVLPMQHD